MTTENKYDRLISVRAKSKSKCIPHASAELRQSSPSSQTERASVEASLQKTIKERILQLLPILNNSQIAREVNCSREYVRQVREYEGIKNPFPSQHCSIISEEMLGKLIDIYTKTGDIKLTSEISGFNQLTIKNQFRRYGINILPRHKYHRVKPLKINEKLKNKCLNMIKKGIHWKKCCTVLHISQGSFFEIKKLMEGKK